MKKSRGRSKDPNRPAEIPMTDVEHTDLYQGMTDEDEPERGARDVHAAGTPGGGTALGGLAGTNVGDGAPENADLEDALGSGVHDAEEAKDEAPFAGPSGGAVGGTPAQGRAQGGR